MDRLQRLYADYGQSVWLDYIDRNLLRRGGLEALIAAGLRGVTSNPTIFHQALSGSTDYDNDIRDLLTADPGMDEKALYEWLVVQDVRRAADLLAPVYEESEGTDGFVSLEVDPHLAHRTGATVNEARHLWRSVNRPNLMIKVPATQAGIPAIEALIADGVNVNVTLLFSIPRYREVQAAYLNGVALNEVPRQVASVASFFLSRIDALVDRSLEAIGTPDALALRRRAGLACARLAYRAFKSDVASERFALHQRRGARYQRPLWASTMPKGSGYPALHYVEHLIGGDTVVTVVPGILDALQANAVLHGTLDLGIDQAESDIAALQTHGINLSQVAQALEEEGVRRFVESQDRLFAVLGRKRESLTKRWAQA
jgi:transaldolase